MMRVQLVILALLVTMANRLSAGPTEPAPAKGAVAFKEAGVFVPLRTLFAAIPADQWPAGSDAKADGLALVTATGVYALLESAAHAPLLNALKPGEAAVVTGKVLPQSRLLQLEQVLAAPEADTPDLAALAKEAGQAQTLTGRNLCQCGLAVDTLDKSCKLGHLHHLQMTDGTLYHYLPTTAGLALFKGQGSHFKTVEVQAKLLPGNFLWVTSVTVK